MATHTETHPAGPCPNCGHELGSHDHFCARCGQENHPLKVPMRHIAYEFIEGIWHFDNKIWTTIKAIVLRPGQITKDFLDGRRVRYVPPIRLYVFVSALFFILVKSAGHLIEQKTREREKRSEETVKFKTNSKGIDLNISTPVGLDSAAADSLAAVDWLKENALTQINRWYSGQGLALSPMEATDLDRRSGASRRAAFQRLAQARFQARHAVDSLPPGAAAALSETLLEDTAHTDSVLIAGTVGGGLYAKRLTRFGEDYIKEGARNGGLYMDSAQVDAFVELAADSQTTLLHSAGIEPGMSTFLARREVRIYHAGLHTRQHALAGELYMAAVKALPFVAFVLMPVVALLLFALNRKRRGYYYEHLIHSIHLHTILFIVLGLLILVPALLHTPAGPRRGLNIAAVVMATVYPLLSNKRVYGRGWGKTVGLYLLQSLAYMMLIVLVLLALAAVGLATF